MILYNIQKEIPDILLDIRYCTTFNFIGEVIDGYIDPIALGTKELINALKIINQKAIQLGYRLKIYDTYRPQRALDHFMRWKDTNNNSMKSIFYPEYEKKDLFEKNFIIEKSAHTRGSTVDLTLVNEKTGKELDMGSYFDFFGDISKPLYKIGLTSQQIQNRIFLRTLMLDNGFLPLESEWWHYTLKNEPYPNTYFDLEVKLNGN